VMLFCYVGLTEEYPGGICSMHILAVPSKVMSTGLTDSMYSNIFSSSLQSQVWR
jgi:hypothetical protein